jgi:hypothetical protein
MYAEKVPKWSRNGCQNASKINAKTGDGKYQENHKKTWFYDVFNHAAIHEISTFSRKGVFEKSTIIAGVFA